MAKGWKVLVEQDSLWSQVLKAKYVRGGLTPTKICQKPHASNLWRGMASTTLILHQGSRKRVLNGASTLFWKDPWLDDFVSEKMVQRVLPSTKSFKTVAACWTSNDTWDWISISCLLPGSVMDRLHAVTLSLTGDKEDGCVRVIYIKSHFIVMDIILF